MRLRVALLAPPFESVPPQLYGGTERVVHELARGLHARHVDCTVFASGDSTVPCKLSPVTPVALRLRQPAVTEVMPHQIEMLAKIAQVAGDFDILHNHNDSWMLPLHRMSSTPMVTTIHGRLDIPDLQVPLRSFHDARFISISNAQRNPVPDIGWIRTIPHGIDVHRFQFYPEPGKYLAFLGRISMEKRPDLAIDMAMASGVPLKIAAKVEGKRDQEYFDTMIRPRIDGKFIEYIGEISESEKSEFLGNALALAFPIDWPEPFGLVMIESLACGTPVLARPLGSVPEILQDGVTGFVDLDLKKLVDRIPQLGSIDRNQCRRWVCEKFSLERMVQEHLDVYQQVLSDRRNLIHPLRFAGFRDPEAHL